MKTSTKKFPKTDVFVAVDGWSGQLLLGNNHSYWWKEEGKDARPLSGITSILGVIGKPALLPWAAKMACESLKSFLDASEKSADGIILVNPLALVTALEEAKSAHTKRKEAAGEKGTDAHALIEEYIKHCIEVYEGKPLVIPEGKDTPRVREFHEWAIAEDLTFIASETPLADPTLSIAGTPDAIAKKGDSLVILDYKTSSGIYDRTFYAQVAAYGSMYQKHFGDKSPIKLAIVHAPSSKPNQPLKAYWSYDWAGDFDLFTAALTLYRGINNFTK